MVMWCLWMVWVVWVVRVVRVVMVVPPRRKVELAFRFQIGRSSWRGASGGQRRRVVDGRDAAQVEQEHQAEGGRVQAEAEHAVTGGEEAGERGCACSASGGVIHARGRRVARGCRWWVSLLAVPVCGHCPSVEGASRRASRERKRSMKVLTSLFLGGAASGVGFVAEI